MLSSKVTVGLAGVTLSDGAGGAATSTAPFLKQKLTHVHGQNP